MKRKQFVQTVAGAALCALALPVFAQGAANPAAGFPSKPIRIVVGYAPDGTQGSGVFELPLHGETTSDVTWQGRHVVGNTLMLGQRSRREEKSTKAYLHFRDPPKELEVKFAGANPNFLQVTVGPREQLSASVARVPVEILVPKGAESVSFVGDNLGSIELTTTHPVCPRARLNVSLIVEP